jgi:hypothetical protein
VRLCGERNQGMERKLLNILISDILEMKHVSPGLKNLNWRYNKMKTKKSEKKMKLNKITVSNLGNREMHQVMGGCPPISIDCKSLEPDCDVVFILDPGTVWIVVSGCAEG